MSNFLGDVSHDARRSMILSLSELAAREGRGFAKNMNYREDAPSVMLVSDRGEAFTDRWHESEQLLILQGHDASKHGAKKSESDQEGMHESGALSDNGKFYKAAQLFKDGVKKEAMQVQVYERLSDGAWYDKGLFSLVDAKRHMHEGRRVFNFALSPLFGGAHDAYIRERMIPAGVKAAAWERDMGKCALCGEDARFFAHNQSHGDGGSSEDVENVSLRCAAHAHGVRSGLL